VADNVAITAGAGTSIGSDDISSVQYQRIKLIHGADGTNDGDVSNVNPLPVSARQSQTWYTGDVPGHTAAALAAGDQVGTLITLSNAARATGGGGWINSILLHDNDDVWGAVDLVFFHDVPTLVADNVAFNLATDAHARMIMYVANLPYFTDLGANRVAQLPGIAVPYFCTGTSLYVAVINRVAATPTSNTGLQYRICVTRD
jgi:hypothetical protein